MAVGWRAVYVMPEGECPHPRRPNGRGVDLEDTADNGAVGQHVVAKQLGGSHVLEYRIGQDWRSILCALGTAALQCRIRRLSARTVYAAYDRARPAAAAGFLCCSFATAGIVLATLNWRNNRLGFWCNAVVIGIGDIPFILFVLVPGYMPVWPGILGPVLWIAALVFTAIAQVPMSGAVGRIAEAKLPM